MKNANFLIAPARVMAATAHATCRTLAVALTMSLAAHVHAAEPPLRTAVDGSFAPHAFAKLDGGLQGFNIDLVQELAKRMKREITIDSATFSGLIPALNAGRYDFLSSPISATPERTHNLLFTEGYLYTEWQFAIRQGEAPIKDLSQLKGKTIAVNKGSPYHKWALDHESKYGFRTLPFETQPDAIQAVVGGRAYATLAGNTTVKYMATQIPRIVPDMTLTDTRAPFALPFKRGNEAMRNEVERALECLKADGTLARISEKWFGSKPGGDALEVNIAPGFGLVGLPGYDDTPHELECD
jgi:polar amino acid transport system substrate-binding protein